MQIILASDRTVSLAQLHQRRIYQGLLCGRLDARETRRQISVLLEQARRYTLQGSQPVLIAPLPQMVQRDEYMEEQLPAVTCVAVLESDELARMDSEPYSQLTVAWFQEEFAPPIASQIEERIRAFDWETLASDWCW